jgi:hypothetical protein
VLIIFVILGAFVPTLIAQQLFEPDLTAHETLGLALRNAPEAPGAPR